MSIEKLKSIDQSKIKDENLKAKINEAIATFDGVDDLSSSEENFIANLAKKAGKHIEDNDEEAQKKIAEKEARETEEKEQEKNRKAAELINSITLPHAEYLKEKGIEKSQLPADIRQKIIVLDAQKARLIKNPDNEKLKQSIINLSEKIKQHIMNKDEEKKSQETAEAEKKAAEEATAQAKAAEEKANSEKAAAEEAEKAQVQAKETEEANKKKDREGVYENEFLKSRFGV